MKKFLLLSLFGIVFSSFCFGTSKKERTVNKVMHMHAELVKKKYGLKVYGMGSSIPDDVKGFDLNYLSDKKLNLQQSRELYIRTSQLLLDAINSNEQLCPYMYKYPFDHNNLEYSISFYENNGKRAPEHFIAYVSLVDGKIFYASYNNEKRDFIDRHVETYEEALRIVQGSGL